MQIKVIVLVTVLFFLTPAKCKLRTIKKDNTLKVILQDVLKQCKAKGLMVYTLPCSRDPLVRHAYSEVLRQIGRITTVASVNTRVAMSNYMYKRDRGVQCVKQDKKSVCKCGIQNYRVNQMVLATDNILFVYVLPVKYLANESKIIEPISKIYKDFGSSQSSPKMLVLTIVTKKFSAYQNTLRLLCPRGFINVEIMEIYAKAEKTKLSFEYKILQLQFFSLKGNGFTVVEYKKGAKIQWFRDKVKSCNKKLQMPVMYKKDPARTFYNARDMFDNYNLLKTMQQLVNITVKLIAYNKKNSDACWSYRFTDFCSLFQENTYVTPIVYKSCYLLVAPKVSETVPNVSRNSDENKRGTVYSLIIGSVVFACWIVLRFRGYQLKKPVEPDVLVIRNWKANCKRKMKRFFFVLDKLVFIALLSLLALYLYSYLFCDFTLTVLEGGGDKNVSIALETFEDLKRHNITVFLPNSRTDLTKSHFYPNEKIWSGIKQKRIGYAYGSRSEMKDMLQFRNASIMVDVGSNESFVLEELVAMNQLLINKINTSFLPAFMLLRKQDPFLPRLSDIAWRYFERGLYNLDQTIREKKKWRLWARDRAESITREYVTSSPEDEEELCSVPKVSWILYYLLASLVLPIFVLILEMTVYTWKNTWDCTCSCKCKKKVVVPEEFIFLP